MLGKPAIKYVIILVMKRITLLSLLFLLTISQVIAAATTISVTGKGVVQAAPDTANIKLGVEVSKGSAQDAQNANAGVMAAVAGAIGKLGIEKDQVQTSGFQIYPEMKHEQNQPPKIASFRCGNQINITVDDLALVSKVIDAGIGAGANNVQGIRFSINNDSSFKKAALEKAVKDAKAKAQAIAAAAGLRLGAVKSIIESGAIVPLNSEDSVRAMALGGAETPVSPGLLEIRGNVTLTYQAE